MEAPSAGGSSTSPRRPSRTSPRSARASSTSGSPGNPRSNDTHGGLGRREIRDLAARHGVRPSKALGQNFLADPNLARAIAADAGAAPGVRAIDVGAGFGSVTVALAEAGAEVLAIEFDRALLPALHEVVDPIPGVEVVAADALRLDWAATLGSGARTLAANLPYNIAVPLLLRILEEAPQVSPYVVMIQRELAERLAAAPGSPAYGSVSAKIAYDADVETLRRVPRDVFWPRPKIESSVIRMTRRRRALDPGVDRRVLFEVIDVAFGERRKTMTNALRRLGLDAGAAVGALAEAGVDRGARAEELSLEAFARVTSVLEREGAIGR